MLYSFLKLIYSYTPGFTIMCYFLLFLNYQQLHISEYFGYFSLRPTMYLVKIIWKFQFFLVEITEHSQIPSTYYVFATYCLNLWINTV